MHGAGAPSVLGPLGVVLRWGVFEVGVDRPGPLWAVVECVRDYIVACS